MFQCSLTCFKVVIKLYTFFLLFCPCMKAALYRLCETLSCYPNLTQGPGLETTKSWSFKPIAKIWPRYATLGDKLNTAVVGANIERIKCLQIWFC